MAMELSDGVWWYDLGGVNAYLVDDGGTLTLVDAGMPWHGNALVSGINQAGYDFSDLDRILLTHYDFDHVGGLTSFDGIDLTIYAGVADAPLVTGERTPSVGTLKGLGHRFAALVVDTPSNQVETIGDGQTVGSFTAYHTPGHTRGHMAYVSEDLDVAFLGDCVREAGGEFAPSPWYLSANTREVPVSIRRLSHRAGEFEVAAPGHGVPFRVRGSERLENLAATL
ncbi:MBL fold metallo-hydrolase [Halomicroarcula sp. GCM10025324]|uniref:MBL fold metallo-hydrolase n=1 Tax=Haloarcula TaxID=2237 RepID=UPI0023E84492|nr:MBL fold metallo-hydrolase [Halomicroarcula sp. ZS-22-S1]